MGSKSVIFLACMAYLVFMWLQDRNRSEREVVASLLEFTCKAHLVSQMEEAIEQQKKDQENMVQQNFKGLAAQEMIKKEKFNRISAVIGARLSERPQFIKAAENVSFGGERKRRKVVDAALDKAWVECPDEIKEIEHGREMLNKFMSTFFKMKGW